ncbi:MAG: endonuclease domain-containing protein [Allosphingosinicella sp.]|uniref:endonuclease domain-containing protein n=1 Tax=Allosphingosinicella sp. TaxID=2823234 RepID=UPI00392A88F6
MSHPAMLPIARKLRRSATEAEQRLWHHLRGRRLAGAKFRRQVPVGRHVADFLCDQARLIVEVDGGQHADNPADAARTTALQAAGYQVLRFWNHDVLADTDAVLEEIARTLRLALND